MSVARHLGVCLVLGLGVAQTALWRPPLIMGGKENEFLEAARTGDVATVEKYLYARSKRPLASLRRTTPTTNVQDSNGYSALHYAALNGHADVVQVLLIGDANPNIQDTRGSAPLHLAAWAGHHEIVQLLLSHHHRPAEANLLTADHDTPLHCAAQHGHTGALTTLLAHGADPTIMNARGETPFDLAAQYGRLQAVQMLIRAHPDLLAPYRAPAPPAIGHTPLHLAARNGHARVVELLLAAGMDVNVATGGGSALHEAALCGKDAVVRLLLAAGADLAATDHLGRTPLDLLEQFPPHVTRRIVNVIQNWRRPRSTSPRSPARVAPAAPPKKPPRRNLSVSPTNLNAKGVDVALRDYDTSRKLKRWRHSHFIEHCINAARCPLSPTNYLQPPTPEHAPPSAAVAETVIHLHMRPLSCEWRRGARSDVATSPDTSYTASSDSGSDVSDASDTMFRGTVVLTRTRRGEDERSRTMFTHQRFELIRHERPTSEPLPEANHTDDVIDTRFIDVRCLLEKKEWRALSKSIEFFGNDVTDDTDDDLTVALTSVNLGHLREALVQMGFDSLPFIATTLRRDDLTIIDADFQALMSVLPAESPYAGAIHPFDLHEWLRSINLAAYADIFERHLVTTWRRVSDIWESELQTLLEIQPVGHRRRILASIEALKGDTIDSQEECRHPLEIRNPLELVGVGVSAKWRHQPLVLVTSAITYRATYLGATPIDVTPSAAMTRQSIVTLRRNEAPRRAICLTISHRGIERHAEDASDACEHALRDIAFACQDAEDFSHFAYITNEGRHLCHVFSAQSMDVATEIILTIGQCFEIAYQMALCDG